MNHFDEMACLLYLEGQLEAPRARELAAHLGECAECRALLHALESESRLLSGALTEEDESVPARLLVAPGWSIPSWVWVTAFGIFAGGAYWLWTDSIDPWLQQISSAGFGGTDLASLLLFSGAFWEGWGDMIDVLQIAALIVMAIVAFGLLRRRFRRTSAIAVVTFALALAVGMPQPANAAEVRRGQSVVVSSSEVIHNDLIASGSSVRIDGTVEGDVIAFTGMLTVTGHVTGDVIAFAGQMRMNGVVDGNIRVISHSATIEGTVGKNITSIANTLELTSMGTVGGSLTTIDGTATLDGKIQRDVLGIIRETDINGRLGQEVWLRGRDLMIGSSAEIDGPATFQSASQPVVTAGAKLASPIRVEAPQQVRPMRFSAVQVIIHEIVSYGAGLLLALLLLTVLPGFFRVTLRETARIGLPIGVGALALIAGVFLAVLGILLIFVGVGAGLASALLFAPILYIARIFVSAWLGNKILGNAAPDVTSAMMGRIALGLLILQAVGLIPVLGVLSWLAVILWGTGAVLLGFYRMSRVETESLA